jgi:hypothetical protein
MEDKQVEATGYRHPFSEGGWDLSDYHSDVFASSPIRRVVSMSFCHSASLFRKVTLRLWMIPRQVGQNMRTKMAHGNFPFAPLPYATSSVHHAGFKNMFLDLQDAMKNACFPQTSRHFNMDVDIRASQTWNMPQRYERLCRQCHYTFCRFSVRFELLVTAN